MTDFAELLLQLPEGCPVVGGQAVAWWAAQYRGSGQDRAEPLTSADIDFWGGRDALEELARRLGCEVTLPLERIRQAAADPALDPIDCKRLANFRTIRWPQVIGTPGSGSPGGGWKSDLTF